MYEYNVVVGLFKLEFVVYIQGDLKEKAGAFKDIVCIVQYTELAIKRITISLFPDCLCLAGLPRRPARISSWQKKLCCMHIFAERPSLSTSNHTLEDN